MYTALIYLCVMLAIILLWFIVVKRPIYESILLSFVVLIAITNKCDSVGGYILEGLNTSLVYTMTVFVAMSVLLSKTGIIDGALNIFLALLGRIPGGAGYASVIASCFMGAISGSGPGNVMTTGVITIPLMKKTGFPAELAANIESTSSYLGNMIPPSSNIVAALGAFMALYPDNNFTTSRFWIICWGCSIWFILLRLVMVFFFCKYYKIEPMPKESLPSLRTALREGWMGLFLPIIILTPFLLDFFLQDSLFTARLGSAGAKQMSKSMLYFVAGMVAIFVIVITRKNKKMSITDLANMFGESIKSISPAIGTCLFGYMIGAFFADLNVAESMQIGFAAMHMNKVSICLLIPLITCFLGMVIPGSSLVVMFGTVFISLFASAGVEPLLIAAMLPCICGVMCGITPPLALGMYAGMTIAESDFSKTVKNDLWWVATQYILEVIVLMGWLPIVGL